MTPDPATDPTSNGTRYRLGELERRTGRLEDGEDPGGKAVRDRLDDLAKEVKLLRWTIVAMALGSGIFQVFFQGPGAPVASALGLG